MADLILEIVEGKDAGRQLELDRPLDVGRDQGMPISLTDDTQGSRRHARVSPQNGVAVVEDLGSTNGTYVNDQPIHAPRPVNPGDKIRIGLTVIELRSAQQVQARPSAVQPRPQFTQVGDQVLAPVPEQELAPVAPIAPAGALDEQPRPPGFKAQETPPGFVPPEGGGAAQAESDYKAIARLVDTRVKQQRNVAAFAMLTTAALAVIIYFGVT